MSTTVFDQFLAGHELASAFLYLAMGCLIGWNAFGVVLMLRSVALKKVSSVVTSLAGTALSLLATLAVAVLGLILLRSDPRVGLIDVVSIVVPAIALPMYCWRIEATRRA